MEYELKDYYRVKFALVCARQSFLKIHPRTTSKNMQKKIIDRAYFIIFNKIDELGGTNERLLRLRYYRENVEKSTEL